jgi:hypothetical protein|tara:strand:- start:209 stop:646 length:438 start_codon:yes stop_codon:yes gene_type:complete
MMDLKELREQVERDARINDTELDTESLRLPQLHNKYLNLYHDAKLWYEKAANEYNRLYKLKWEYYTGKIDAETLKQKGWEPFDHKILRNDVSVYMNGDDDLCNRKERMAYIQSIVNYLDEVVKEITFRHTKIKNAIEWRRFLSGG